MKIDGIKEIRFVGRMPIAYTDFSAIYLSCSLRGDDYLVAKKHEKAHIWLQHQVRFNNMGPKTDKYLLNIAGDLEIAKHIYNNKDEIIINNIHSLIHSGITKKDCQKYPNCNYMEEFYQELIKEKNKKIKNTLKSIDALGNIFKGLKKKKLSQKNIKNIIAKAKKNIQKENRGVAITLAQQSIINFKFPKPTLASVMDSMFGRNKIVRMNSYRRLPRRESDFLKKGIITVPKLPRMTVFVDRSGSFDNSKTIIATEKLNQIIKKYRGKIRNDTLYFNDNLLIKDPQIGSGGTNYQCVIDFISRNLSELVIIITDNDQTTNLQFKKYEGAIIIIPVGCSYTWIGNELKNHNFKIKEL